MNVDFLSRTALFQGIEKKDLEALLGCLEASVRKYEKGRRIFHPGDPVEELGLVMEGVVHMVKTDIWGRETIIGRAGAGQVFGETYACRKGEAIPLEVTAARDSRILFLNVSRVLETCPESCGFHNRMVKNLVYVMAGKNLALSRKIDCITPRSIRERIMEYLSGLAMRQEQYTVEIPFSRQQLADYLSVDRSALSNELSRMQREGLISYKKNTVELKGTYGKERRNDP